MGRKPESALGSCSEVCGGPLPLPPNGTMRRSANERELEFLRRFIVSMIFGFSALFRWKPRNCPDSEADLCWLHHCLVMDGCFQAEYLHCTDPMFNGERVKITFRWIRNHVSWCPLGAGVACCLPTCARVHPFTLGFGFSGTFCWF